MGHLVATGRSYKGHKFRFEYKGEGKNEECLMICECNWKVKIETFRHPWSIIETKMKSRNHYLNLGLTTND